MKTMKKICVLMLCVVMALSAFGCAKSKGKGRSGGSSANAAEDGTEDFKTEKAGDGYRILRDVKMFPSSHSLKI